MKKIFVFFFIFLLIFSSILVIAINFVLIKKSIVNDIKFKQSQIDFINFYYEDYSFVFELKGFFIRVRPFIIYDNCYYDMKEIITWIKNNYPDINYKWLINKVEYSIHYGFNLTNLPEKIINKIDYIGFRLVDLNFPLSWFELEKIEVSDIEKPYNFTKIHIPKANLIFSFEDLYPYGYSIEHINSTYILIGNVKNQTNLYIDPIVYSDPIITITGYSDISPCNFQKVWESDLNGSLLNLDWTASPYSGGLTKQIRPADSIELTLNITVINYSPPIRSIILNGTDMNDNFQTETITINSNGVYITTLSYKTINPNSTGIVTTGTYDFKIEQNRWGIINALGIRNFLINARFIIGDDSTLTYFKDKDKIITFPSSAITGASQAIFEIKNNVTFILGQLDSVINKTTSHGCFIFSEAIKSDTRFIYAVGLSENITVGLYSTSFIAITDNPSYFHTIRIYDSDNIVKIYGVYLENAHISQCDNLDIYDLYVTRGRWGIYSPITNSIAEKLVITNKEYGIYANYAYVVNISNVEIINPTYYAFRGYSISENSYFTNIKYEAGILGIAWMSGGSANFYIQYTFNLVVVYSNGSGIKNANVTLTNCGQNAGIIGTWLTYDNGSINEQILIYGFYNSTGKDTIYDYNPYNLTITYDNLIYTKLFNITEKINWKIAIQEQAISEIEELQAIGLIIMVVSLSCCLLIVAIYGKRRKQK